MFSEFKYASEYSCVLYTNLTFFLVAILSSCQVKYLPRCLARHGNKLILVRIVNLCLSAYFYCFSNLKLVSRLALLLWLCIIYFLIQFIL